MIGTGMYTKMSSNKNRLMSAVRIAAMPADTLCVAQFFILREVLTSTAVEGSPPNSPEPIFASAFHKISFCLLNFCLVVFSPIFPEIMVSRTVIMAMITLVLRMIPMWCGF